MRGRSRRRRGTRSSLHAVDATTLLVCFVHADGIIVNDIGLEPLIIALQRLVLLPLARELFSSQIIGTQAVVQALVESPVSYTHLTLPTICSV